MLFRALVLAAVGLASFGALAQEEEIAKKDDDGSIMVLPVGLKALVTEFGVYGAVGGGVQNFTESSADAATGYGGYWDARVGIGTRTLLGLEVGYNGSARDIGALGLNDDAYLIGHGLEGVARLNVPLNGPGGLNEALIEPYSFGGLGWQRFALGNVTTNTSDISESDDVMVVPMGAGLVVGYGGLTLDARLMYRHAIFSNMMGTPESSFDPTSLSSWSAGASLGFEF